MTNVSGGGGDKGKQGVRGVPASPSGYQPTASAATLRSASSQSGVPNAVPFSPGPWDIAKDSHGVMTVLRRNANGNPQRHIANICWADSEGGEPDANLIAAAPDLYAFAEWAFMHATDRATVNRAEAALAKARGEQ